MARKGKGLVGGIVGGNVDFSISLYISIYELVVSILTSILISIWGFCLCFYLQYMKGRKGKGRKKKGGGEGLEFFIGFL